MTQKQTMLHMFKKCGNRLTLREIMQTNLACEYRSRLSDLRRDGWQITCTRGKTPSENLYELVETKPGQLILSL